MKKTKLSDIGQLVLRLGMGGLMLPHGINKIEKLVAGGEISFPDPLGIGPVASLVLVIFSEALCSVFLILGFKTRLASVPLIITMAVAAFVVHMDDPWNKMEFSLVYLVGFCAIFFLGGGRYSFDRK